MTTMQISMFFLGCVLLGGLAWDLKRRYGQKAQARSRASKEGQVAERSKTPPTLEDNLVDPTLLDDIQEGIISVKIKDPVFNNQVSQSAEHIGSASQQKQPSIMHTRLEPSWTALHVMAKSNQWFAGSQIESIFEIAQLRLGRDRVYHYHDGETSQILFSVASALEPGCFNMALPQEIENFKTPGLVLFMKIANPHKALHAFEQMLRVARQLATRLDGDLKDQFRNNLTIQAIEKSRETIRETTRKLLLDERLSSV
ncbi:MAG: cell division protein ZipA C-terminal FtsZ-binding domain-containing protein [Gammaproteobacteria bacterium]